MLNIPWNDFITNVEVLEQAETPSIETAPMGRPCLQNRGPSPTENFAVYYFAVSTGHTRAERGAPKKRYKDCLKKSLTACHVDHQCWSDLAADRGAWRHPDPPSCH